MISELLLYSKNDIPFIEAQVNIHQPTIKEISLISEESFHIGCRILTFSVNNLSYEDKVNLGDKTNFEVLMSIMNNKSQLEHRNHTILLLTLLFPEYEIKVEESRILLIKEDSETELNEENYNAFTDIINSIFCLKDTGEGSKGDYNPSGQFAAKIADKLKKGREKATQSETLDTAKISILSNFVSILSVGVRKDVNVLMEYTVFQLRDEIKRFQLKQNFDTYLSAKLAGAQDLEDVEDWMKNIHP